MVAKKENGRLKFDLASAINLLPIIFTIVLAAFVLSGQLAGLEARMVDAEKHIGELRDFKEKGQRFTLQNGEDLKNMINEFKIESRSSTKEIKLSVKEMRTSLNRLALSVNSLEQMIKRNGK